ncbi:hypothetical protein XELAEV_18022007mg [Xenopus laevis]|uniref:Tetraspanin n=1 Tax=Xenopus laevis TaxID=8355 RepID=A0A974HNA2_XENLA|nr:hypothetical protein XELAEV_18022007mg [Xenopus laevis]
MNGQDTSSCLFQMKPILLSSISVVPHFGGNSRIVENGDLDILYGMHRIQDSLAGGVILGVALWLRHDPQTSNLLFQQFEDKQAPGTFYIGVYIIIAVGAVMMFVGFLGCYGAIQESQCLLGTFFACLVILFACEVAAGIWGFVNRDQVSKEMRLFYSEVYQHATTGTKEQQQKALPVLKAFHETLQCCGDSSSKLSFLNLSEVCPKRDNILEQFTIEVRLPPKNGCSVLNQALSGWHRCCRCGRYHGKNTLCILCASV